MIIEFRDPVLRWFAVIAAIAILISGIAYRSIQDLIENSHLINATHEILETLSDTLASLGDISGGQRGYVLTGQEEFLAPYHVALTRIDEGLERLARLIVDNPSQQRRLPQIRSKIEEHLASAAATIASRRDDGLEAAREMVLTGRGEAVANELRQLLAAMAEDARRALEIRTEAADKAVRGTLAVGGSGVATTILVLLFVFLFIRRENVHREAATAEIASSLHKMRQLTRDIKLSGKMVELLQSCRAPHEAHIVIEKMVPQLLPEVAGAVCLINSPQNAVEAVVTWGGPTGAAGRSVFAPDDCWALRRGRMHLVEDSQLDPVCAHAMPADGMGETLRREPANRGSPVVRLCVPMIAHGEALGVMYLRSNQTSMLTEDMQDLARTVSEQIGLALSNLKLQETLRAQSVRDPLTGLFNRRYMEASLQREISHAHRHGQAIGIVMLDIDHFKRFNDTFGHEAGDAVLAEFGRLLKSRSRGEDIACRYGGEEFMLILPEAPLEVAVERAEQLRQSVHALKVEHHGQSLGLITASFGVAAFKVHGEGAEDMIRAADAALYRAKEQGRDRVVAAETAEMITLSA